MPGTVISPEAAVAMLDALTARLDAGAEAGYVEICGGLQPPNTHQYAGTNVVLAIIILNDPAFGQAIFEPDSPWAEAHVITGSALTDLEPVASGIATWFRAYDSNNNVVLDGSIGTSMADMIVNTARVDPEVAFTISSWQIRMPTGEM